MVQRISRSRLLQFCLLCKGDCLSPPVMKKSLFGHFLFPLSRRNWEIKAPSLPALPMMTRWSAPTRRRLPSTWSGVKLTHLVFVFYLEPGVEKKTKCFGSCFVSAADLWCIWFDESVQRCSSQSLQTGHVVSRGVLHRGQRGGPHHFCLERWRQHHGLKKL